MNARVSMSRRRFAVAFGAFALIASALAQDPAATVAALAAREWLAYTDSLDAATTWERAGKQFKNAMSVSTWTDALRKAREPRGKIERRAIVRTSFTRSIRGRPDADYALVLFRTAFAKRDAVESITLERESDGVWRVIGYVIR